MCYRVSDMITSTLFLMKDTYFEGEKKKKPEKVTLPMPLILSWEVFSAVNAYIYPNDSQLSHL